MLHKSKGIVFHTVKYGESSIITKIYTEKFGIQSYIINGIRSPRSKSSASLYQPPALLDMVIYHAENKNLQRIKEVKRDYLYTSVPFDIVKSTLALFIIEVLNKCIREAECDENLFAFIKNALTELDRIKSGTGNFHLNFLLNLTRHLGFVPEGRTNPQNTFFDLKTGHFVPHIPGHPHYVPEETSAFLCQLIEHPEGLKMNSVQRSELLNKLLEYYALHSENFGSVRSYKILQQVFEN